MRGGLVARQIFPDAELFEDQRLRVQLKFALEEETCGAGLVGAGARGGTGRVGDRMMFPRAISPPGG